MGEQRNSRWNWEVTGFEPRKSPSPSSSSPRAPSLDYDEYKPGAPLVRRYSISSASVSSHSELSKHSVATKLQRLNDKVKVTDFNSIYGILRLAPCLLGNLGFELVSDEMDEVVVLMYRGLTSMHLETNGNGGENLSPMC